MIDAIQTASQNRPRTSPSFGRMSGKLRVTSYFRSLQDLQVYAFQTQLQIVPHFGGRPGGLSYRMQRGNEKLAILNPPSAALLLALCSVCTCLETTMITSSSN
ncbi:uncharacterized protein V6R79_014312 [Siganus canaliculatus]